MKHVFALLIALLIIGGAGFFFARNYYYTSLDDKSGSNEIVEVEIPKGSTTDSIAAILLEKKLIDNDLVFKYYLRETGQGGQLKAGKYEFFGNQSLREIVDELVKGALAKGVKVVLPEGLRYDESIAIIAKAFSTVDEANVSEEELITIVENPDNYSFTAEVSAFLEVNKPGGKNLEGFLFPDTYEFAKDSTSEIVITKLLEHFVNKTKDLTITNGLDFYKNLIIASITEREASPPDYEGVSGVFLKRIQQGDKLGSDVTLLYYLKRWQPEPTFQELQQDHPYNTRRNFGLTPTPIGSPGLLAIERTGVAKPGEYLFFLADSSGKIHYGKNLAEHEANIRQYLR